MLQKIVLNIKSITKPSKTEKSWEKARNHENHDVSETCQCTARMLPGRTNTDSPTSILSVKSVETDFCWIWQFQRHMYYAFLILTAILDMHKNHEHANDDVFKYMVPWGQAQLGILDLSQLYPLLYHYRLEIVSNSHKQIHMVPEF